MNKLKLIKDGLKFWMILRTGHIPSQRIRKLIYKYLFKVQMGKQVVIYGRAEIREPHLLKIGDYSIIGHDAILDARCGIEIGNNVNLSSGVWIWTVEHDPQCSKFGTKSGKVIIKDYSWISCRTVILPGVTVGEGAVVAAGAVVTKNISDYTIVGGIPAKEIGKRNKKLTYQLGKYIPFI